MKEPFKPGGASSENGAGSLEWKPLGPIAEKPEAPEVVWRSIGDDLHSKNKKAPSPLKPERRAARSTEEEIFELTGKKEIVGWRSELGGTAFYREQDALKERRPSVHEWEGAPLMAFDTFPQESAYMATPEVDAIHCQDALAFEYDRSGKLLSFALADGVSTATFAGSVADMAARLGTRLAAEGLPRSPEPFDQESERLKKVISKVEDLIRGTVDMNHLKEQITKSREARWAKWSATEDERKKEIRKALSDKDLGTSTLFLATVQTLKMDGQNVDRVHFANLGDGGYAVVGPTVNTFHSFDNQHKGPLTQYINAGNRDKIENSKMDAGHIDVPPGHMLVVFPDGPYRDVGEENVNKALKEVAAIANNHPQIFVQELFKRLVKEVSSGSQERPWADDTTVFCHANP